MNKEMTREIVAMVRDIIADEYNADEIGDWEALTNWYSEMNRDLGDIAFAEHYSVAEVMAIVVSAMEQIHTDIERETNQAIEQAQWETRYYNERDYGGRL
jgi:hypothetical protein